VTTQSLNRQRKESEPIVEKPTSSVMEGTPISESRRKRKREKNQSIDDLGTWDSSSADIQLDASIASGM